VSEIILVRQPASVITDADKAAARRVIFGVIDGLGDHGKKQWRRFWNMLLRLEAGEMVEIRTHKERLGWYHRKHMALEQAVFESQERFEIFKAWRDWLKVGAGHCNWYPGPKGAVFPVPKSISYGEMEQGEMEEFHTNAVAFLRTEHAQKTLWKHLTVLKRSEFMELLLAGFRE
jgi:Protein of unknown function (DUF1367)